MIETINNILSTLQLGKLHSLKEIAGGNISKSFKLEGEQGSYFLKYNANVAEDFFECEHRALALIGQYLRVPKVLSFSFDYILLEYLELENMDENSNICAAQDLARLHQNKAPDFGLGFNNYIGTIAQCNGWTNSGSKFYAENRILSLAISCRRKALLSRQEYAEVERLCNKLDDLLPNEEPSLLHGDLWSGNLAKYRDGVCFYDPFIYYGYRETDLAMTRLFGGFSPSFYSEYNNLAPLKEGWEERQVLFEIYPLLVHLFLFGSAYKPQLMGAIRTYL